MGNSRKWILQIAFATLGVLPSGAALSQTDVYPSKPVRVIIPFGAAGSTNLLGRVVADFLSKDLGQAFVVLNLPGAGGSIGTTQVVRAPSDGYTLMVGTPGPMVNSPHLGSKLEYDPVKDFQAVGFLWTQPMVVLVSREAPFRTLKEFIAEAKRQPGKLFYGSSGVGSTSHLAGEIFNLVAGVKLEHVPYKDGGIKMADLKSRRTHVVFTTPVAVVTEGDMFLTLAVAAPARSGFIPSVPTSAEAGLADFNYSSWGGLFARTGTPTTILDKLGASVARGLKAQSTRERFLAAGVEPLASTPAELMRHVASENNLVRKLVETTGLKVEE